MDETKKQVIVKVNLDLDTDIDSSVKKINTLIKEIEKEHNSACTLLEINISQNI